MIANTIGTILGTKLQKNWYYDPVANIEGDSLVISFIQSRYFEELYGRIRSTYEWDIHYIPSSVQKFQTGDQNPFTESGDVMEECAELLRNVEVIYTTKEDTDGWFLNPILTEIRKIDREYHLILRYQLFYHRYWGDQVTEEIIKKLIVKMNINGEETIWDSAEELFKKEPTTKLFQESTSLHRM